MKTTLLIDADILAYQHASAAQEVYIWPDGSESISVEDPKDVAVRMVSTINTWVDQLDADDFVICLTSPNNFRYGVLPSYKHNRKDVPKPVLLGTLKEYLNDEFGSYTRDGLEADDVMGILATHPELIKGKKIIVSIDKDMKQIPGWLFNPDRHEKEVRVTEEEGDFFFLYQCLTGDTTDGYGGCKGIGDVKATKALLEDASWATVVKLYGAKGFTEEDALVQARVARICRYQDYDYVAKEVKLWTPPVSSSVN